MWWENERTGRGGGAWAATAAGRDAAVDERRESRRQEDGRRTEAWDGRPGAVVADLRGTLPRELCWPVCDVLVLSGLPGGGKSTLLARAAAEAGEVCRVDSQEVRESWQGLLPYALVRPLARVHHYLRLRRAVRSFAGGVAVHDCGQLPWVRRWLAWEASRVGRRLHLLLLDVTWEEALSGQRARRREVSGFAFRRHVRAMAVLRAELLAGRLPPGCASAVLLDRPAAAAVRRLLFVEADRAGRASGV
nr:AAA family ATPase [Streptomyces durbertensis]